MNLIGNSSSPISIVSATYILFESHFKEKIPPYANARKLKINIATCVFVKRTSPWSIFLLKVTHDHFLVGLLLFQ